MKRARMLSALLVAVSIGCGESPTGPTEGSGATTLAFPTVTVHCGVVASTVFFVTGLSDHVRDGGANPLEAVMQVGEAVRLSFDFEGCLVGDPPLVWTSTDTSIAALTQQAAPYDFIAELTARAPGETTIFVDFRTYDGGMYRTYPAYCPRSQWGCLAPRSPIARVRVVAPSPAP